MAVTESGHLASREIDDLYRRHGGDVYRYAYAVLGNHADARDARSRAAKAWANADAGLPQVQALKSSTAAPQQ